jgi:hypothetical protein
MGLPSMLRVIRDLHEKEDYQMNSNRFKSDEQGEVVVKVHGRYAEARERMVVGL